MLRCNIFRVSALLLVAAWGAPATAKKKHPRPAAAPAPVAPAAPSPPAPPAATDEPPPVAAPAPPAAAAPPVAAPAAAPPAVPPASPSPSPSGSGADLEALQAEYSALRDELFRSRAKAELLGAALFKTRLTATFRYQAERAWPLKKVALRLDDQPVYGADAPNAVDPIKIFDGFAVPGRHTLTVRVECGAVGDARQGYAAESTLTLDLPDGKQTRVALTVDETGDGPQALAKKKQGSFDLRVRADVRTLERDAK